MEKKSFFISQINLTHAKEKKEKQNSEAMVPYNIAACTNN